MKNRNLYITLAFFALIIIILFWSGCNEFNRRMQSKDLVIEAMTSVMKKSINKAGEETAEKKLIMISYNDLKKLHVNDSSEIGKLKKIITKQTIAATIVKATTSGTLTGGTHVIFLKDSTGKTDPCNPIYTDTISDKWTDIIVTADKDSIKAKYTVRNEFETTQEWIKEGKFPFRQKVAVVKHKNKNPHTTTTEISSFVVQTPNHKKRNAAIGGGIAVLSFILGIVIAK